MMKIKGILIFVLSLLPIAAGNKSTLEPSPVCNKLCTCQVTCGNSNPLLEKCCMKNQQDLSALALIVDEINERLKNISTSQKNDMSSHSNELKSLVQKVSDLKTTVDGFGDIQGSFSSLETKVVNVQSSIGNLKHSPSNPITVAKDCVDVYQRGHTKSGIYTIDPDSKGTFHVWCDMDSPGGGWTVFQRRQDGSQNFFRVWEDYKIGFGKLNGEFWLGNDKIHRLTKAKPNKLRIDLEDLGFHTSFAEFTDFSIADEAGLYKIMVKGYSGTSGNSFSVDGLNFSSKDKDHDTSSGNCASSYKGGWWYNSCHSSNLNGLYLNGKHTSYADGVEWRTWRGYHYSLKNTEMKIKLK